MSSIQPDSDAGRADFLTGHSKINTGEIEYVTASFALIGLTNFGARPVSLTHLAEVWGRTVSQADGRLATRG